MPISLLKKHLILLSFLKKSKRKNKKNPTNIRKKKQKKPDDFPPLHNITFKFCCRLLVQ